MREEIYVITVHKYHLHLQIGASDDPYNGRLSILQKQLLIQINQNRIVRWPLELLLCFHVKKA